MTEEEKIKALGLVAGLLGKSVNLLYAEAVTPEQRALADSCRETAKELRLFVTYIEHGSTAKAERAKKPKDEPAPEPKAAKTVLV